MKPSCHLLLCTDMDRTVIPNGIPVESRFARRRFHEFVTTPEVTLAYVTGRDQGLVMQAITEYDLPLPKYAITDVGTKIYHVESGVWEELQEWKQEIDGDWHGQSATKLHELLADVAGLKQQELSKQNDHKLSYYVDLQVDRKRLLDAVEMRLCQQNISANLVWSIDDVAAVGLLDILPQSANKLHALNFLRQLLNFELTETLFAGDSGNDLDVMCSVIPSVLVANASDEVRAAAQQRTDEAGNNKALYCASGQYLEMNGNYSAGILEGVWHFSSEFRDQLSQLNSQAKGQI